MPSFTGVVVVRWLPPRGVRWTPGYVVIAAGDRRVKAWMSGVVVQWIHEGDRLRVEAEELGPELKGGYKLWREWGGTYVMVWPLYSRLYRYPRLDPVTGEPLYEYVVRAREASSLDDYTAIVELEQYHYASRKELVAVWRLPSGEVVEANAPPCDGAELLAIKGSLPASRFLILELVERSPYEPRVVGYVRVDPPVPLMHRRVIVDGKVVIERNVRLRVFPRDWIYPTFWPEALLAKLRREYRALAAKYGRARARYMLGEKVREEALRRCNTAAARIARVVIHPDYRGDGLGMLAVKAAIEWIRDRRVPEMRKRKHVVETIAQMARYHPFFERVGFKYLWDTASGRPALYYPLTEEARGRIEEFLKTDPHARRHGGVLYRPRYGGVEPLSGPIIVRRLAKLYESVLDISELREELADALKAFGVTRRVVQRFVLRDVDFEIRPREVVAVVGLSGAGKTTLLRMIIGAAMQLSAPRFKPDAGQVIVPDNVRAAALLPGELEPEFGEEPLLEHMYRKLGDVVASIEVLNISGLSDAVFYRARFAELSTGQKERAKLASLLAERPNLVVIDEFAAHLDALTAQRVGRKLSEIARRHGITLIVATNRPEVLRALSPTKVLYVGYGTVLVREKARGSEKDGESREEKNC